MLGRVRDRIENLGVSPAALVICLLALGSVGALLSEFGRGDRTGEGEPDSRPGAVMWVFSKELAGMYSPVIQEWNTSGASPRVELQFLSLIPLARRMQSGFLAGTPVADLIEVERQWAASTFRGPLEQVGFVDLTDRLRDEGLLDEIAPASFSPWTSRGRIFGLPHDVHPVMLGYRSDLVEAAGIDVSTIETWEDYFRVMSPLTRDANGDGRPDHAALAMSVNMQDQLEVLLLQAGEPLFDEMGRPKIATERNAHVLASVVSWSEGREGRSTEVLEFSAAGDKLKLDGAAIGYFMPDWMCVTWRQQLPQLAGSVRVMPLPAWERGGGPRGRRTSVWGGTMLGIPKAAPGFERLWAFAKHLYLSPELTRALYTSADIITPVKKNWSDPMFDRPDAYFGGQPKGRMYINLIDQVPVRASSPYNTIAVFRVRDAAVRLRDWARSEQVSDVERLKPKAMELLAGTEEQVRREMSRNVFLDHSDPSAESGAQVRP